MKIKEILNEDVTDVVARFYKEASAEYEEFTNPDDVKYKNKTKDYYKEHFQSWFEEGQTPVFTTSSRKQPPFNTTPKDHHRQSPGYRGKQYALAAAGLPYDHDVQGYSPNPTAMLAPNSMNGARNNNGN